ncbi:MAG: 2-amino-4-hydroxy-6-hydroxymethyldihydropteridine diphosphokinase, partial [Bacteroidales bacterium]|nr:2-amino-4-hydroxy-6-hydroxymethyldihydropteridine diphosphokinase [Bacteroidales bacterium]
SHLASLGARPMPRSEYLRLLDDMPIDSHLGMLKKWASHTAILLLGSNEGERQCLIAEAERLIGQEVGSISLLSDIYESSPWGFHAEQWFLNQAVAVETAMPPDEVLRRVLSIEERLGRRRQQKTEGEAHRCYSSRPIDIDIIFYDSQVIDTAALKLPHPLLHKRRFVLIPLCNICSQMVHPTLHKTVRQLLDECPDDGDVRPWFDEDTDYGLECKERYERLMAEEEADEDQQDRRP